MFPLVRVLGFPPFDFLSFCFRVFLAGVFTVGGVLAPELDVDLGLELLLFPFEDLLAFSSLFFAFLAFLTSVLDELELEEPEEPDATEGMTSPCAS